MQKDHRKSRLQKSEAKADWDQDSKMAHITYDSIKTNADAVLQRIAASGYDSEKFTAPDDVYANLHGCCQYERPKKMEVPAGTIESGVIEKPGAATAVAISSNEEMVKKQATTQSSGNPLSEVYSAYFALKNALVASDGSTAATQAKNLFDAVANVKMEVMNPSQHTAWMKFQQKLSADAGKIKDTQKIKQQREHFASLSKNMYEVMKVVKPETPVYYDHCPMYNDGKGGNWISTEKAIKNPYYGNQMLTCGSVKETLK